jgi:hypothetical protein
MDADRLAYLAAEMEDIRNNLLAEELRIITLSRSTEGRVKNKLDRARAHTKIAVRQISHILYPVTDPGALQETEIPERPDFQTCGEFLGPPDSDR